MPYPKGKKWTPEQRAKLKGRTPWNAGLTREEDPRIAQPWLGKERAPETRAKIAESVRLVKGDSVEYNAAHARLRMERGTPSRCEHCGASEDRRYEWAYTGPDHASGGKPFSLDTSLYVRLCMPCHYRYDLRELNG